MSEERIIRRYGGENKIVSNCYICNTNSYPTMIGIVPDGIESGQRIVEMCKKFDLYADMNTTNKLCPDKVSVSFGACERHAPNLKLLEELILEGNRIDPSIIVKSLNK